MDDSVIKEAGSHDFLLQKGGGYADIYKLQARIVSAACLSTSAACLSA